MKESEEIIKKTEKYCAHNYAPLPVVLRAGKGVWLWDVEGKKYLDMLSCYSALSAGHGHKKIYEALSFQASMLANCSRAYYSDQLADFAQLLCRICKMEVMLPMNSGAEAVETAIKIARKWGYQKKGIKKDKAEIIVCKDNFHGRTTTIVGFSSDKQYKDGFGPFSPGFVSIPFGNAQALERAINENTAAFLVEPIQGEAGIIVPPEGYLRKAKKICQKHNVLFIADEIQTGLARTGKIFACWHEEVQPDMFVLGKALGGGLLPVSAVVSYWSIMDVLKPGDHGSTFGGGPLACAVAKAYLELMIKENFADRAKKLGRYFLSRLKKLKSPYIKEIRGKGLLIGLELKKKTGGARRFCESLAKEGILSKETHDYAIRFAPPLIITKKEIDWAMERIEKVFK